MCESEQSCGSMLLVCSMVPNCAIALTPDSVIAENACSLVRYGMRASCNTLWASSMSGLSAGFAPSVGIFDERIVRRVCALWE